MWDKVKGVMFWSWEQPLGRKEIGAENIFEELLAESVPHLVKKHVFVDSRNSANLKQDEQKV